jgi:hypothetical protein
MHRVTFIELFRVRGWSCLETVHGWKDGGRDGWMDQDDLQDDPKMTPNYRRPPKGIAKRGSNNQITKKSLFVTLRSPVSHSKVTFNAYPFWRTPFGGSRQSPEAAHTS